MKITSISEAEAILQTYVPEVAAYTGDGMSLDRMWPLLAAANNPHEKLRAVHIAGTSGKTSTAYYTAALLNATGKKVGLTVSPHVDSITERVQINGENISDEKFCSYLGQFLELIEHITPKPSYFELMIVFIYWVFAAEQVDYAVVETGMGGLLDGTNVLQSSNKVCVITDIGFDHMHVLGKTIPEIAAQKAGIIHKGNQVYMYQQADEVMQAMRDRAGEKQAKIHLIDREDIENHAQFAKNSQIAQFQSRNYTLAFAVVAAIAKRDNFALEKLDPLTVVVPGRIEAMQEGDKTIIMDGAHNEQKVQTFVDSFIQLYPDQKVDILIALKKGKEYTEVIDALLPIMSSCIVSTFQTSQDLPAVSQDPETIAKYAEKKGIQAQVQEDFRLAYRGLLEQPQKVQVVIGSFYLLGQLRATLK